MNWSFAKKKEVSSKTKPQAPLTNQELLLNLENSNSYGSITIDRCGCSASLQQKGQLFGFKKVPSLPLEGCSASQCTCVYQGIPERRHIDRRVKMRRESFRMEDDRRQTEGRRTNDLLWSH